MTQVYVNGKTYSDDGSTPLDMLNGGSTKLFFPLLNDVLQDLNNKIVQADSKANQAQLQADQAATRAGQANQHAEQAGMAAQVAQQAASTAILAPGTVARSSSTLTVATPSALVSLAIQPGKLYAPNMFVLISNSLGVWMHGQVASYDSAVGALTVRVGYSLGNGTYSNWDVSVCAPMLDSIMNLAVGSLPVGQIPVNIGGKLAGMPYVPGWRHISLDYQAQHGDRLALNTFQGNATFTVTLPSTPNQLDYVTFWDAARWLEKLPVKIARNQRLIENRPDDLLLDRAGALITLVFYDSSWRIC